MEFQKWLPLYEDIAREFGFSMENDRKAARQMARTLDWGAMTRLIEPQMGTWARLQEIVNGRETVIFGAADRVDKHIRQLKDSGRADSIVKVAVDGATTALLENDLVPDIIVTDLDGKMRDIVNCVNNKGSIAIVHAHGDNTDALRRWLPRFRGRSVGTTQHEPHGEIRNYGGFTDGDRAAFIMEGLGAALPLQLAGFDFENVGKYSYGSDVETKARKLKRARHLLDELPCEFME